MTIEKPTVGSESAANTSLENLPDRVAELFELTMQHAGDYRRSVGECSPYTAADADHLRALFDTGFPETGTEGAEVIEQLVRAATPGLIGTTGGRFLGWVVGASHPVGVAADWLTSAWGQNAALYQSAPAAGVAEEVAAKWILQILDLPPAASVGFTTGGTMANFACLAAARSAILRRKGWDVEADGLIGAPEVSVLVSEEAHSSVFASLRMLGFGTRRLHLLATDEQGRIQIADMHEKLKLVGGPALLIAQAGQINSGASDDFAALGALAKQYDSWLHVDGAFGLWAKASPKLAHLCADIERADSWAVDGHKFLQVPYGSGYAIVKDVAAHKRAMEQSASYLNVAGVDERDPSQYVPELARRALGFPTWAMLKALGREGIARIVETDCKNAQMVSTLLAQENGVLAANEVVLNQVVLRFVDAEGADITDPVIAEMNRQRRWFVKGARWKGCPVMRLSFSAGRDVDVPALAADIVAAISAVKTQSPSV